jgi:hypothetical protein
LRVVEREWGRGESELQFAYFTIKRPHEHYLKCLSCCPVTSLRVVEREWGRGESFETALSSSALPSRLQFENSNSELDVQENDFFPEKIYKSIIKIIDCNGFGTRTGLNLAPIFFLM